MIELQVVGKDGEYFFVRNKGSESRYKQLYIKKQLEQGLKLQKIIKNEINIINNELCGGRRSDLIILEYLMEKSKNE